jgi:hypothetical protein
MLILDVSHLRRQSPQSETLPEPKSPLLGRGAEHQRGGEGLFLTLFQKSLLLFLEKSSTKNRALDKFSITLL